jgi:DnaJ domain
MQERRAALEGIARILDASAPEDLFTGPPDEAIFLYGVLAETARARSSAYYWEICRTARRRGVTPEYVVDRASVLLGAIHERRRTDLYRILGVPPLASPEVIRQRWIEVAKRLHPDVGGDGASFQHAKQAYEVLRDAERRSEYERFWLRTLGPVERAVCNEDLPRLESAGTYRRPPAPAAPPASASANGVGSLAEVPPELGQTTVEALAGLHGVLDRATALLAPIRAADVGRVLADVERTVAELERLRDQLRVLATLKASLSV